TPRRLLRSLAVFHEARRQAPHALVRRELAAHEEKPARPGDHHRHRGRRILVRDIAALGARGPADAVGVTAHQARRAVGTEASRTRKGGHGRTLTNEGGGGFGPAAWSRLGGRIRLVFVSRAVVLVHLLAQVVHLPAQIVHLTAQVLTLPVAHRVG